MTRLETEEVGSDEVRNLRSWERHKSMKKNDEDQGDKMGQSVNSRLMCQ